ncbi:winged helix-turn-helix transcriptional regulator [Nocardia sp. NPDC004068]|uniref:winged helix-turn-helix transcriptional regulator n=1 Tax=Nocardia sp. NPDC004068 TaxID=3364303 RepID=UPI0036BECD9C
MPENAEDHPAHAIARRVHAVLSTKWALATLEQIAAGHHRFRELHRALPGVSAKVLTQTLRRLENHALITRFDHATPNPRVDYTLTEPGRDLLRTVHGLCAWSRDHLDRLLTAPAHLSAERTTDARPHPG